MSKNIPQDGDPSSAPVVSRRRSRRDEFQPSTEKGERLEEWMMTYMDTVTLLVTLFVLILSFANMSEEKYNALVEGLSLDKHSSGVLSGARGIMDIPGVTEGEPPSPASDTSTGKPQNPSDDMTDLLQNMIADQGLQNLVEIKISDGLVDLQLQDSVLFPSGTAELLASGRNVLQNLMPLLIKTDYLISVQGHTDSVPISTPAFPSNWELSGARAAAVVREMIANGIAENRLELAGLAHTRPVADNDTVDGRRKNRRVNILLHATAADIENILSR